MVRQQKKWDPDYQPTSDSEKGTLGTDWSSDEIPTTDNEYLSTWYISSDDNEKLNEKGMSKGNNEFWSHAHASYARVLLVAIFIATNYNHF